MGIVFALLSALSYGSSDFIAGLASRRCGVGAVIVIAQPFGLVAALLALVLFHGESPGVAALLWGSVSGVGSGLGTVVLYRGFAIGRMSVVAPLSAIVTAVVPALVGIGLGEPLSARALAGIAIAVPATGLVSWQPRGADQRSLGVLHGLVSGAGFALLFIALDRAGTAAGAWPLVPGQVVALLVVIPFARYYIDDQPSWRPAIVPSMAAGALGGAANLLFLAATGSGQLAIMSVMTALYPAVTILLARIIIGERWNRLQLIGLLAVAAAIALVSAG
jgi:drug/metabolite transporter (DMT)-like permease